MTFHIISLFPQSFDSYIHESILKRAQEDGKIRFKFYNPRDFTKNKWRHIDDKAYGGGPGMVIQALPVIKAIEKAIKNSKKSAKPLLIWLSPSGKQFTNIDSRSMAKKSQDIVIVCGRYEGIDSRARKVFKSFKQYSIGPFVLTGGELPAMIIIDTISRQIPGVLGNINSLEEDRVASCDVYTRPADFKYKGKVLRVPKILRSGNHAAIDAWRSKRKGGLG